MTLRIFLITLTFALSTSHALTTNKAKEEEFTSPLASTNDILSSKEKGLSLNGMRHVLAQDNPRATMTCNNFPRVCRAKGSPGPDCCRKQCVNVMTDNLNCWQCGRRCRYGEACCGGSCVNIMYDPKNCGGCRNKCKKGSFCRYGMCSYA